MPDTDQLNDSLSLKIGKARAQLLETLQKQLETCISEQIIPRDEGVPFININNDPPQIASIKKIINALYYAEEGLRIDTSTAWAMAKGATQAVSALNQIYKSLSQLNDATPEIQSVIADNYHLLEPVFSGAYDAIQNSGWVSEFSQMEAPDIASTTINKGIELLGPDIKKWNGINPLLDAFSQLSQLFSAASDTSQTKKLPEVERRERVKMVNSLIQGLETNPFFQKITARGQEETTAVHDLLGWFKNIQDDDFEFTQESIKRYISWANHYLPTLIMALDQFERQSYMKSGLLTQELTKFVDKLATVINDQLAPSFLDITERVSLVSSLTLIREQGIEASQMKEVQETNDALHKKRSVGEFILILDRYKGQSFSDLLESDRIRLRQIYPAIQYALAHSDFDLENKLANTLNTVGPVEKPASKTWWQLASGAASYVTSFVVSGEIDNTLAKRYSVYDFFDNKIASAKLKITVAEQALDRLKTHQQINEAKSLNERVREKIHSLTLKLPIRSEQVEIQPGDLTPVKASSLNNLRGNITYLQELHLSDKVNETRENINILIKRNVSETNQAYFSTPPYNINSDEPELVVQIKTLENALYNLATTLHHFETIKSDFGLISKARMLLIIAKEGLALKQSMAILSPATREILAPILGQLSAYGNSMSDIDAKSSDLSQLGLLNQLDVTLPKQNDGPTLAQDNTLSEAFPSVVDGEEVNYEQYGENIARARELLLHQFKSTLSTPLSRLLNPESSGVPFINFENEPPQVIAIKKVINGLYYAESAIRTRHKMNFNSDSMFDKVILAHQLIAGLSQIYKSLSHLNDATPEIQSIITDNYNLLEPVFSETFYAIKKSGWISEFSKMEAQDKASTIIIKGTELLGSDWSKWNSSNPLMEPFSKLSQLFSTTSDALTIKKSPEDQRRERVLLIISIIQDLETNPFFKKITARGLEESKVVSDLLDWFKSIQEDDFEFTQASLNKYISWANHSLPILIVGVDQFEQQNYLKSGLLTEELIKSADKLATVINEQVASSSLNISGRVAHVSSFSSIREQGIDASQLKEVQIMIDAHNKKHFVDEFILIIENYKEHSFSDIIESDRIRLRQIYPEVQYALAHADLDVENKLSNILNVVGPEERSVIRNLLTQASEAGSYESSNEIDKTLAKQYSLYEFFDNKINSAKLKITVAEQAREQLNTDQNIKEASLLEKRVQDRIDSLSINLTVSSERTEIQPGDLIPVKASSLNNLQGNLTYLRELNLSKKLLATQVSIDTLIKRHLPESEQNYFSSPPYQINSLEPELIGQIKAVSNTLYHLTEALKDFENLKSDFGKISKIRMVATIVTTGFELKQLINLLSPAARQVLGPVLSQLMTYGASMSAINTNSSDLSELGMLNQSIDTVPKTSDEVPMEQRSGDIITTELPTQTLEAKEDTSYEDYANTVATTRAHLLTKLQATLTTPLTNLINPRSSGVPFIDYENEPSQATAIKNVINCMYYAEAALRARHKMNFNTDSVFDNVILAHQGIAALSHAYKSVSLLGSASPELTKVVQNNYDLIDPVFRAVEHLVKSTGWTNQLTAVDITKSVGSHLGQGLNLVQSKDKASKTFGLVNMLSDLPLVMNRIAKRLDPAVITDEDKIIMTQDQIDSISEVAELFIEGTGSVLNLIKGPYALISLLDLSTKINKEGNKLQNTTVIAYQEWIDREYPQLLIMIDEVEVRNYLKPGTLSAALIVEIDAINTKLNETIEAKLLDQAIEALETGVELKQNEVMEPGSTNMLKKIMTTSDLVKIRDRSLRAIQYSIWSDTFNNEVQQRASREFFAILAKYEDKSFTEIRPKDRSSLRAAFAKIQDPMSFSNLDLANEFLTALNQLELSNSVAHEIPFTIKQLMNQENTVQKYLEEQKRTLMFRFEVIDEARTQLEPSADHQTRRDLDELAMLKARDIYIEDSKLKPIPGPGKLKTVNITSTKTARGSFSKLQELKLSSHVELIRARFSSITNDKMSGHIHEYLKKPEGTSLHVIHKRDPVIPRHIKQLENGFYRLETAFRRLELLNKNDTFVTQLKLILEIEHEVRQIKQGIYNLSPELKTHYGPLVEKVLNFSSMIQNIDYDKEDTKELKDVLKHAKEDLLKLKTHPYAAYQKKKISNQKNNDEANSTTALRGLKLGVKYLHVASPQIERARALLLTKYGYAFDPQPLGFRSYTREQLADKTFMLDEVTRLNKMLDTAGYFDLKKANVIFDVAQQVMRVGAQAGELAGMVNKLITDEYVHIKEASYRDFITALSREEDYLCLKPGTLINQGMTLLNQLFLSAALELDMPFNEKLKLLDDAHYINIVVEQAKDDLNELEVQLDTDPLNAELALNIAIKKDKILFLNQQVELHRTKDFKAMKSSLLDIQFEILLRDTLFKSFLNKPIIEQYEHAIRKQYVENKLWLLSAQDSGKELTHLLGEFERKSIGDYLIVSKAIKKLITFGNGLPENNRYVKDYLRDLVASISNEELPINLRAEHVKSLPKDSTFVNTLSLAADGLGFLTRFKQFIERITQCIVEGITTGANIIARYYEIKLEQKMENIERTLNFKAEVNTLRPIDAIEQDELSTDEQVELNTNEAAQGESATENLTPVPLEDEEDASDEHSDDHRSNTYR